MKVKFVLSVLHFIRLFPAVRRRQLAGWRENHYLCLVNYFKNKQINEKQTFIDYLDGKFSAIGI